MAVIGACGSAGVAEDPKEEGLDARASGALPRPERPSDFGFVVRYGLDKRNVLDTFAGTFTKDLWAAGTATIELRLTDEELDRIYAQIVESGLASYPSDLNAAMPKTTESTIHRSTHNSYSIYVVADGQSFSVSWIDSGATQSPEASQLITLVDEINSIVGQKEEYQALPPTSGGAV